MVTSTLGSLAAPPIELNVRATCEALSCSRSHLRWLETTRQLVPIRRGRKVSYSHLALLEFSERGRIAAERGKR